MRTTVLIAEDHPIVRSGLRALLEAADDIEVCGEACDGEEAVRKAKELKPQLLLLDISMPKMSGLEVTRLLHNECPDISILVLTMHEEEGYFFEILDAGASGYLLKGTAPADILSAIRAVVKGGVSLHPSLARGLVDRLRKSRGNAPTPAAEIPLSPRELQVLDLTAQGLTARELADKLKISSNTVQRHRANIMSKLGFSNRAQLVRYAVENGLLNA